MTKSKHVIVIIIFLFVILFFEPFIFFLDQRFFQLGAIVLQMSIFTTVFAIRVAALPIFVVLAAGLHVAFLVAKLAERMVVFIVIAALPAVTRLITLVAEVLVLNWSWHAHRISFSV